MAIAGVSAPSSYDSGRGVQFKIGSDPGKAYFFNKISSSYDSSSLGNMLGTTDGTVAGTTVLRTEASGSYIPLGFVAVADNRLVLAGDSTYGSNVGKVLVSDGTVTTLNETTFVVAGGIQDPSHQSVWFYANSAPYGTELVRFSYASDATPSTVLVKDIYPGSSGGLYSLGAVLPNGKLVFSANDGLHGAEPWVSDGTANGTIILVDLYAPSTNSGSDPSQFTNFGNKVAFVAWIYSGPSTVVYGKELVFTDGTAAGTTVLDITPGSISSDPVILGQAGGLLYFTATTVVSNVSVKGIFSTDGTTFARLSDINSSASLLAWDASKAYFKVSDVEHGDELWAADFSAHSFAPVKDILPGSGGALAGYTINPFMVGGKLAFNAYTDATHQGLFLSDGTNSGTVQLSASVPTLSKVVGDTLVFADTSGVYGVAAASASPTAVTLVDATTTTVASSMQKDADQVFFKVTNGDLYATNGTASGTVKLASSVENFKVVAEDALFFVEKVGTADAALWYSDGTSAGTHFIEALPANLTYNLDNAVAITTVGVPAV